MATGARVLDKAAEMKKKIWRRNRTGTDERECQSSSPAAASSGRSSGSLPHCGCSGLVAPGSAAPAPGPGRSEVEKQDEA